MNSEMKFEEGWVVPDGQQVVSLENIPMYSKNEALQELVRERDQLDEAYARLAEAYGRYRKNRRLFLRLKRQD